MCELAGEGGGGGGGGGGGLSWWQLYASVCPRNSRPIGGILHQFVAVFTK